MLQTIHSFLQSNGTNVLVKFNIIQRKILLWFGINILSISYFLHFFLSILQCFLFLDSK